MSKLVTFRHRAIGYIALTFALELCLFCVKYLPMEPPIQPVFTLAGCLLLLAFVSLAWLHVLTIRRLLAPFVIGKLAVLILGNILIAASIVLLIAAYILSAGFWLFLYPPIVLRMSLLLAPVYLFAVIDIIVSSIRVKQPI